MSYTVLARRYRSQDFDELIGQEPVARTLQRAIESNRVAHAYLFTGTRGVGKTSMARIFAKALNATPDLTDVEAIGKAIMQGGDIDVIEIDAASNRGVEEARDLIANCIYRPARCPHKIYIIDEVHMLTREAFNALLKTMEEPPPHVKFILCTTEPHKVPTTIQSRCQRFDFRTIPAARIAAHLKEVLKKEKVKADERVIFQIARLGNGSMRDALSLLDRLLAAGEKEITPEALEDALGLPDSKLVEGLVDTIAAGDARAALETVGEFHGKGISLDQMLENLIERLRVLMLVAACSAESEVVELSEEERETAAAQAAKFDVPAYVHMIALLENVQRAAKSSSTARAIVDAAIVRLALAEKFADAARLLSGNGATTAATPARNSPAAGAASATRGRGSAVPQAAAADSVEKKNVPSAVVETRPLSVGRGPAGPRAASDDAVPTQVDPAETWQRVLAAAAAKPNLRPALEAVEWDGRVAAGVVRLKINDPRVVAFARLRAKDLSDLVGEALGRMVKVDIVAGGGDEPFLGKTGGAAAPRSNAGDVEAAARIPLVRQAMELLDARIVGVDDEPPPIA